MALNIHWTSKQIKREEACLLKVKPGNIMVSSSYPYLAGKQKIIQLWGLLSCLLLWQVCPSPKVKMAAPERFEKLLFSSINQAKILPKAWNEPFLRLGRVQWTFSPFIFVACVSGGSMAAEAVKHWARHQEWFTWNSWWRFKSMSSFSKADCQTLILITDFFLKIF